MEKIGPLFDAAEFTTEAQTAAWIATCCALTNTLYFKHYRRSRKPGTIHWTKAAEHSLSKWLINLGGLVNGDVLL